MTAPPRVTDTPAEELLRRLELAVNRRLDGLLQGDYRGLVPGHGTESGDARRYTPGDDVRRIDWNVTARMSDTYVRDTIADRELESWVLIDRSASLRFGTADCEKYDLAVAAAAAFGFLTLRTGNRFGAAFADADGVEILPPGTGRTHLLALVRRMADVPAEDGSGATRLGEAVDRVARVSGRRGLVVVVSDFLGDDTWARPLRALSARHDALAVEVIDPRELELPDVGVLELTDPETGRTREVQTSDEGLRDRFSEATAAQRDNIAGAIRGAGADHLVLRTDRDWLLDLLRFVTLRRKRLERVPATGTQP